MAAVAEEWLKRDQAGNRSRAEVERVMRREVLPALGERPVAEVRKRDLIALVEAIADRGAPVMANRTLAHVKRLFRWAAGRDLVEADPAAHVEKPAPERRRDRALDDGELRAVWRAAERLGGPFGAGVRLLAATGARREEVFALTWAEVDRAADRILLPPERNKAGEPRAIPLAPPALAPLDGLPPLGPYALSSDGRRPFSNVGHAKARLDALAAEEAGGPLPPWRLHDLRRTAATGLQRLGARLEVIEAVLGHVSGTRAGIAGLYQRHRYEAEAREALAAWAAHLQRLLQSSSDGAEVVPLQRTQQFISRARLGLAAESGTFRTRPPRPSPLRTRPSERVHDAVLPRRRPKHH